MKDKRRNAFILLSFFIALTPLFIPLAAFGQEGGAGQAPSAAQIQRAMQSGDAGGQNIQQLTQAVESGQISPEAVQQAQEKAQQGTLTADEIQAGREIMEQQQRETEAVAEADAEVKPETREEDRKKEDVEEAADKKKDTTGAADQLQIFGHNLFSAPPSSFSPLQAVPVSNEYIIGPGDEIRVHMWGRLDESHTLMVDNEGLINFPKIGPMTVAGLTFGELKDLIRHKAEAITGVNVNISMGKLKTLQVFILGELKSPGIYTVSSLSTVTNALLTAGGPTRLGSLRKIQLKRKGEIIAVIDLYEMLMKGDISADTTLMSGDVIFVPQAGPMVAMSGNVKRPAIYEMKDNLTLDNMIETAGGLAPSAYSQRLQIERTVGNREMIVLDISEDQLFRGRHVQLQDGDLVRVFTVLPAAVNAVYLYGNVNRPGRYAYRTGLRLLDVLPSMDSLKPDTHFDYALIKRYRFEESQAELIPFDLGRLLISGDPRQNIPLMPGDEIHVFEVSRFADTPYAEVRGEVRRPGRYNIDDMTLRDLILKAGDLKPVAYLPRGELIRYDKDRNRHTIYFDVAAVMAGDPAHNIKVRNQDAVVVHSILEEQWEKFVAINGEINKPGRYVLTEGMRLKDLLFKAGSFTRDTYMLLGHLRRTTPRTKDSMIYSFNIDKVLMGDPEHNLPLHDLDVITIHSVWDYTEKYPVYIQGVVRNPGEFPYAVNMTVNDLILLAGNIRDSAYMESAELIRYTIEEGRKVDTRIIEFNIELAQQNHPQHNLRLEPMDVITIKQIPDWWEKKRTVTLAGEFFFPGTYQMRKDETLSSVIARAGGFSEYAYLRGAVFTRDSVKKLQQRRLNELLDELELEIVRLSSEDVKKSLSEEDLAAQSQFVTSQKALIEKLAQSKATGRVIVSLAPLEQLAASSGDIVLEDGDTLFVPKLMNTVAVIGAVYNPTAVIYDRNTPELAYYLDKTGGPTENADEDLIYVIRSDGTVVSKMRESSWWKKFENIALYPGDTILVPERVITSNPMRDAKDITQILYQIATTAGVTAALF